MRRSGSACCCCCGVEIIGALTHEPWFAAAAAPVMIALVAFGYMRLRAETPLSRIFAIAGLFWLAIMLSLGNLDFIVRRNQPVPQTTSSAEYKADGGGMTKGPVRSLERRRLGVACEAWEQSERAGCDVV